MKKLLSLLLLVLIPGVALATPRDDLFADIQDVSEPLAVGMGDNTFQTQTLRLLDDIAAGSGGGGGGGVVTQPTGSNLHTVVDSGTLVCTQPTGTNLHTVVDSGTITAVTSITNPVAVTGTFYQATQPVSGTFWQATQPVSAASLPLPSGAATAAKQPALGTAGTASADVISVQGIASGTALKVTAAPGTSDGLTTYNLISAATVNATSVKASAGNVYGIQVFNNGATIRYLKLYNLAVAPTVGTSTPVKVIMIPAGGGAVIQSNNGIEFSTGIAFSLNTGIANTDAVAVAVSEISVNIDYK